MTLVRARSSPRRLLIASLLATSAAPALAQEVATAPAAPAADQPADAATAPDIVVTGTRLRGDAGRATPVLREDAAALLRAQPLGLPEALNQLPQFSGSVSPRARQGNPADGLGNFLNLRNVGAIRTLVLLDGERLPPTTVGGLVDTDVLPELLIKRVDIATSGVSAVYGSDAVTGVVNFVLDQNFTGLTARLQSGISDRGDLPSRKASLAAGAALLDGRLHLSGSIERFDSDGNTLGDRPLGPRDILAVGLGVGAPGTAANPYVFADNTRVGVIAPGGRIVTGPFVVVGQQFAPDGRVVAFDNGVFAGGTNQIGGSAQAFGTERTLATGSHSTRAYAHAGLDLSPRLTFSLQGLWSDNKATVISGSNFVTAPIFLDNAFLRPEVAGAIAANLPFGFDPVSAFVCGNGTPAAFCLVRVGSDLSTPYSRLANSSYTVKAKLKGELGGDWGFTAAYIHGRARQRQRNYNEFLTTNVFAALDAVRAPGGQIVCRVTVTNPGLYPGCVAYNPFGQGANDANRAALEGYLFGSPLIRVVNTTDDALATVTGTLGHTGAGPIRLALGVEYRAASLRRTSNADPAITQVRTGVLGVDPTAPRFVVTNAGAAAGSQDVKEANVELEVPLARDAAPLLHRLTVSGAARRTDYSTSGGVSTWKLGGIWEPTDGLTLRAARSRDIRAPTLFDLFAGGTSQRAALVDAHCNCQPLTGIDVVGGGNPDLRPEIARNWAFGVAVKPRWLDGFSASVDYYDLKIRDAITVLSPAEVIAACETAGGAGPSCAAVVRPLPFGDRSAANAATRVFTRAINAASLATRGLDVDMAYRTQVGASTLGAHLVANRVLRYVTQNSAASPAVSSAGYADNSLPQLVPKWTGTLDLSLTNGPLFAHVATRYIDQLRLGLPAGTPGGFVYAQRKLPAIAYVDLGIAHAITAGRARAELFLDIHNLLDRDPPVFPSNNLAGLIYPTFLPLYDVVGRYWTVGIRIAR